MLSNVPLLESGRVETTESKWKLLLRLDADPDKTLYVHDITINLNDVTTFQPYIQIVIDKTPYLREFGPLNVETKLSFNGKLVLEGKTEPVEIKVKSDGTNTLKATATVTGIKRER